MIQTAFTSFCCSKSISTHIHETCSLHVINSILTIPITLLTTTFYLPYAPSLLISNLSSSFLSHGVGAWTCGSCFDLLGLLRAWVCCCGVWVVIMGPVRGVKKRKRVDKKGEEKSVGCELGDGDWWDDFSKRITGPFFSSCLVIFKLNLYLVWVYWMLMVWMCYLVSCLFLFRCLFYVYVGLRFDICFFIW